MEETTRVELRPFIHDSFDYLITALFVREPRDVQANVESLQAMVTQVTEGAHANYPKGLPSDLRHSLDRVNYVLGRLNKMCLTTKAAEDEEFAVFADALTLRFGALVNLLEQEDAE